MRIDVLTLFPKMFDSVLSTSIISRAIKCEKLAVNLLDIRDFAFTRQRQVDDYPYGGEAGMVLKPEPIFEASDFLEWENIPVIYFTPQGRVLTQNVIKEYLDKPRVGIICGHYKEIDQRVRDVIVTDEISVGDYILSGGELPAMMFIDAIARLQDGVLNNIGSALSDSFEDGLLGCPHYTRPIEYRGMKVPEVLVQGNHKKIEEWRSDMSYKITKKNRPDLLK
ncbi:MAG: tRNA (guanosine(37)-N1)-methyltransferase TrmD [Candidatus Cloacimonetes bacterium 4572_65]|nr:MAG: tRNA (guanosine(37)-N1)-methyltransferase TrmD [Candidatus Cloacimonetes bacterium 4572_65]